MRYAQLVIGPAGSGKSTYCHIVEEHCAAIRRACHIVNLDPAAESFAYTCAIDIRDLITTRDTMEEMDLGPNGGLVYALEYLVENMEWLDEKMADFSDDDYLLFDCPGQIELYTHLPTMRSIAQALERNDFSIVAVCCLDASFLSDVPRFIGGALSSLSAMVHLELPHVNVLTKCDLVNGSDNVERFLDSDASTLRQLLKGDLPPRYARVNEAMATLLEDYSLLSFVSMNPDDEESIAAVVLAVDGANHYGENAEPKAKFDLDSSA